MGKPENVKCALGVSAQSKICLISHNFSQWHSGISDNFFPQDDQPWQGLTGLVRSQLLPKKLKLSALLLEAPLFRERRPKSTCPPAALGNRENPRPYFGS